MRFSCAEPWLFDCVKQFSHSLLFECGSTMLINHILNQHLMRRGGIMAKDLLDAVYGSLITKAIGDALGAPVEGWYWTEIREKYGHITELMPGAIANTGLIYGGANIPPKYYIKLNLSIT